MYQPSHSCTPVKYNAYDTKMLQPLSDVVQHSPTRKHLAYQSQHVSKTNNKCLLLNILDLQYFLYVLEPCACRDCKLAFLKALADPITGTHVCIK